MLLRGAVWADKGRGYGGKNQKRKVKARQEKKRSLYPSLSYVFFLFPHFYAPLPLAYFRTVLRKSGVSIFGSILKPSTSFRIPIDRYGVPVYTKGSSFAMISRTLS